MKKLISLILAAVLAAALAVPVSAAAESTDARLTQVTLKVKQTLDIGDEYDSFYGELQETMATPFWSLEWSNEDTYLRITADETGKVFSYTYGEPYTASSSYSSRFSPSFPKLSLAQAQAAAQGFLDKVLTAGEQASFSQEQTQQPNTTYYRMSGTVLFNGLESPIGFSITVNAENGSIIRFSRDDLYMKFLGGVPSATPSASARSGAAALLKSTLSLRLEYVLDGDRAVLRYLPEPIDEFYVDGQSGKLINLTELYDELMKEESGMGNAAGGNTNGAAAAPESAADSAAAINRVEQEGIAKLEGVLSKEELDKAIQSIPALGLGSYTLADCSYSIDRETGDVTAQLQYGKKTDEGIWRRYVTADGFTGELLAVSGTSPSIKDRKISVSIKDAQTTAEEFLAQLWGGEFAKCALYNSTEAEAGGYASAHSFTFAQQENGYFLPANSLTIAIDVTDGTVSRLSRRFVNDVLFDSPEGILSAEDALDAWFHTYEVQLGYLPIPEKLDLSMPDAEALIEQGYSYMYTLKLGYGLSREDYLRGIDAKTGAPVTLSPYTPERISYDDLDGCWGRAQAETLAEYSIGWLGGSLEPGKALTQLDLLALLVSTEGYLYNPEESENAADYLYEYAYDLGLLTKAERDDTKPLSRAETVKLLLNGTAYGKAAQLEGIFQCAFTDADQIPAPYYGYAAIAQALGVAGGDTAGNFAPNRTATRLEALIMLYNFMNTNT